MNSHPNVVFHPIISQIQKVVLYETKSRLYLVGCNNRETKFRLLTIFRNGTDDGELKIHEYPNEYNNRDIRQIIANLGSNVKVTSAFGVLGFIRFLQGYYLILVTKRIKCGFIGMHQIYTIKDTVMIKVNNTSNSSNSSNVKNTNSMEQRYLKIFQNIDLKSNFYFSYSYDLTRTLQHNQSAPMYVSDDPAKINIEKEEAFPDWTTTDTERIDYAFRINSRKRFVWNAFLLSPMKNIILKDWLLEITHGYISQSCINIFGRSIYVCLLARRSTRYAGTRFLKRGANFYGDVANEVETEQIVQDGCRISSFTQMRGSIPSHWSQDVSKMVPKPPIGLDISDPFAQTAAKHFGRLLFNFGSPVIIFNLVKKREHRMHESILTKEVNSSIKYLNQFLPSQHKIKYHHFDMARMSKEENVMENLTEIAQNLVSQVGLFYKEQNEIRKLQTGIIRVNCVDCLDRTNTASFMLAKYALGYQLYQFGVLKEPTLEFDSDCVTMLEHLFEDHGDTLALQYGGSQLVHRIKTYRKTAAWASQGNDIMQTLSRYYSNTFSDTEKQHGINLFLGYYIPSSSAKVMPIWELTTDYYMHNNPMSHDNLTDWVSGKVRDCLPYSCSDLNKIVKELFRVHNPEDVEMIDAFSNYYSTSNYTDFSDDISFQIAQMATKFVPKNRTQFSPFLPGRKRADFKQNPSLKFKSSTGSTNSSSSSENDSSSSDEDNSISTSNKLSIEDKSESLSTPSSIQEYSENVPEINLSISNKSMELIKNYVKFQRISSFKSDMDDGKMVSRSLEINVLSHFKSDSYESVEIPTVPQKDIAIYEKHVQALNRIEHDEPDEIILQSYQSCKLTE